MTAIAMAGVLAVLALVLVGAFLFAWTRDKNRSQAVAVDDERLDADPSAPSGPATGR